MKKLMYLIGLMVLLLYITPVYAWYKRTLTNGGPGGYMYTIKNVDLNCNTTIICSDPGYSSCPTIASSDENPNIPSIVQSYVYDYVWDNVKSQQLNGSTQLYFGEEVYYVSWEFEDADGYTSKIVIEQ